MAARLAQVTAQVTALEVVRLAVQDVPRVQVAALGAVVPAVLAALVVLAVVLWAVPAAHHVQVLRGIKWQSH